MDAVKIIECPRDAWQGLPAIIPTEVKVAYLRKLIDFGFRHIDAVSFVAPKYVPQMADSEAVMKALADSCGARSQNAATPAPEIIGIVVNEQGLQRALATPGITTIGYPHSVSPTFLRSNAHMTIEESLALVEKLESASSNLVVYLSMAFGNPYDEPWGRETVEEAVEWLKRVGVKTVSLADTVGKATGKQVGEIFRAAKARADGIELGVHLHSRCVGAAEKVLAAYEAGCRRFDCALTGLGGCPFAGDELVGNIPSEIVISTLRVRGVETGIEPGALGSAVEATKEIRRQYASPATETRWSPGRSR